MSSYRALPAAAVLALTFLSAPAFSDDALPVTAASNGTVTLEWTAPGDDSLIGRATSYDVRYKTMPYTEAAFATAFQASGEPTPKPSGQRERFTVSGLTPGVTYYFSLKSVDDASNWSRMSNVVTRTASATVDVDFSGVAEFAAPYPNPARNTATFSMHLPQESDVEIEAFDISGRHVATIASGRRPAGGDQLVWNLRGDAGQRLAAGVYLVRARIGTIRFTRRVIIAG